MGKTLLAGRSGHYSRFEIERKFVLNEFPSDLPSDCVDICDTYLFDCSLRLRVETTANGVVIGRKLTKKESAQNISLQTSIITSLNLSEKDLAALGKINGYTLNKRRYIYENESNRVVYDRFFGKLAGLFLVEVEFLDQTSCNCFAPSNDDWQEVTGNPEYSGGRLAARNSF
jgi:CYTH domain-containing protein